MNQSTIRETILSRFGRDNIKHLGIETFGNLVDISIVYIDSMPIASARRWLEDNIHNLWHVDIERDYSDQVLTTYHLSDETEEDILHMENTLCSIDFTID